MSDYRSFCALIFVTDTEKEGFERMYPWRELRFDGDEQLYYEATTADGKKIFGAQQDEMGMTASATLTMKLVEHFRPKYIIMPGIAAGTLDENDRSQMCGDVILADMVWNCSNGKYVPKEKASIVFGEVGFEPRPTIAEIDRDVLPYFEKALYSEKNEIYIHIGGYASGSAIVANRVVLERQIKSQYKNTKGLDMESYGVAYAARHAIEPRPRAVIAKGICDFADERKSDEFQRFAAYTSFEFTKLLIEEMLD